eukprot:325879_1
MDAQQIFTKSDIGYILDDYIPKPSIHPNNNDVVILSTDSYDGPSKITEKTGGVYEYNLKTSELNSICNCSSEMFSMHDHGQFIDTQTQTLYIFGQDSVATLDLKSNDLVLKNSNDQNPIRYCSNLPRPAYIPPPIHECHILNHDMHYKMDMKTKKVDKMKISEFKNIKYPKLIYIESKKQLFSFGADKSDKIWYCNVNQQKYEWKLYDIKMPHIVGDELTYDILLVFDNIVFIFYFVRNWYLDIWCIDLLNNKLIKTKYNTPILDLYTAENIYVMKDSDNYGYIVNFKSGKRYKFNVYDIIPKQVIKLHRKHYELLIIGFVKQQENELNMIRIPYVLKQLILLFFPLF